jgi:hypothetical protein
LTIEVGIYTFGEVRGEGVSAAERIRDLMEEIELADQVGLDVFGVGEHHRADFAVSAPTVVLGAAAARRSWPGAARSPSRSRCSASISRTTTSCSPKSCSCS